MHPILIDLGFFALPSYGLLLATAVLAALWTLRRRAERAGLDGTRLVDLALWIVIWALIGSKALLVLVELPRYLRNPADLVGVIRAGGVFLGGFIGALVAAAVLLRRHRMAALPTFDVMVPSLALGQAIGRLGCLAAGCCWGRACTLPWAITYHDPKAAELLGTPLHVAVHPFPVYESLVDLALYALLAALYRRGTLAPGRVFATYLGLYGGARFLLELTRGDAARGFVLGGALSTSQAIGLAMVVVAVVLHLLVARRRRP